MQYDMRFLLYIRTEPPQGKNRKENQRKVCQESKVLINEDRFTVSATSKEEKTSGSKEFAKWQNQQNRTDLRYNLIPI